MEINSSSIFLLPKRMEDEEITEETLVTLRDSVKLAETLEKFWGTELFDNPDKVSLDIYHASRIIKYILSALLNKIKRSMGGKDNPKSLDESKKIVSLIVKTWETLEEVTAEFKKAPLDEGKILILNSNVSQLEKQGETLIREAKRMDLKNIQLRHVKDFKLALEEVTR